MKRNLDDTLVEISAELFFDHVDIMALIVENCVRISGPLARTCHDILRTMCSPEVVRKIIGCCEKEWTPIPRWLQFTLPHTILLDNVENPLRYYLEHEVIPELTRLIKCKPLDNESLITGSVITGLLYYGARWEGSDIDLLIKRDPDYEHTKTVMKFAGAKWDILQMCEYVPPHYYVGDFDQSLVQMCLYQNEEILLMTPLALFSYRTKIVAITLTDDNIYYIGANQNGDVFSLATTRVYHIMEKHREHSSIKEPVPLHNCIKCESLYSSNRCVKKWFLRMKKYETRFPDYQFIYLLSQ